MSKVVECRQATDEEILEHSLGKRVKYIRSLNKPTWGTVGKVRRIASRIKNDDGSETVTYRDTAVAMKGSSGNPITADFYRLESGTTFVAGFRSLGTKKRCHY